MDVKKLEEVLDQDGIVFLTYGGFISQSLIVGMTEALEKESKEHNLGLSAANNLFTVFIELSQNMMNYSKSKQEQNKAFDPKGLIVVGKNEKEEYYVFSQNVLDKEDQAKITPKLEEICAMEHEAIKTRYRELRKSGRESHGKGAGIGFYEIAKRCKNIEYSFEELNDSKLYFQFKAIVK